MWEVRLSQEHSLMIVGGVAGAVEGKKSGPKREKISSALPSLRPIV